MKKYTTSQQLIIECLRKNEASTATLLKELDQKDLAVSEDSLTRYMASLKNEGFIESSGNGPARKHYLTVLGRLVSPLSYDNFNSYLSLERSAIGYKSEWLTGLTTIDLFSVEEAEELEKLESNFRRFFENSSETIRNRWYQKWLIEFAWKSSAIEGNTYDALETETLLLDRIEATGKTHAEAVMILNHQTAIRFVYDNSRLFIKLNTRLAEQVHAMLVNELDVSLGIRNVGVGINGSVYRPLSSKQELQDEFKRAWQLIGVKSNIWSKTLAILLSISYLQPFEDGNKRTARVIANGILYADNNMPLVFGNIDPTSYRRACLAFYELGSATLMKNILLDSWRKTALELDNLK